MRWRWQPRDRKWGRFTFVFWQSRRQLRYLFTDDSHDAWRFLYLALRHVRGLALFGLVLPLMIAQPLRQQFPFLRPSTDPLPLFDLRRLRPVVTAIALMATFVMIGLLGTAYMILRPLDAPPEFRAPAAALNYAIKAKVTGPVFNDYDFGGYLIFRGVPTFIDGRTLPFGKDFFLDYFEG